MSRMKAIEAEKKLTAEDKALKKISNVIEANKKLFNIIGIVLVVAIIAVGVLLIVSDKKQDQLQVAVSELQADVNELFLKTEYTPEEYSNLLDSISAVEKAGGKSFAGMKASYLLGISYMKAEDYANAQTAFNACYAKDKKSYLAPLALINSAVAAEEQGKLDEALSIYESVTNEFGLYTAVAPKALFNAARINLSKGNTDLAKAAFQQIIDEYDNSYSMQSEYSKLSQNVLLTL